MRISEHFKLNRTQPFLDFVDVRLETDMEVFLDPGALRSLRSPWGNDCASLVQNYFEYVLHKIRNSQDADAQLLLSCLNERNEFHMGYSVGKSRGHAFGEKSAESVWDALTTSQASTSGLLRDIEDACLLIRGIGPDMISDAVCNILRGPLIKYTQDMCVYYQIALTPQVASGPIWNPLAHRWEAGFVPLPMTPEGHVVFVPKVLVRHRLAYQYDEYYGQYLLPAMKIDELNANTGLVELLKNGNRRVTKKALRQKYGSDKLAVVQQTLKRPQVLARYKEDKQKHFPTALEHHELSEIEQTPLPNWRELRDALAALPTGKQHAAAYEDIIERILSALFYPSLVHPLKQHNIHAGRKRIDITYTNEATRGFFAWLAMHYPSSLIHVECKNYGAEIGNPELDQLSGRFSPSRGQVGLLVCRSLADRDLVQRRCADTARDARGYISVLDDANVNALIDSYDEDQPLHDFPLIRNLFVQLIS